MNTLTEDALREELESRLRAAVEDILDTCGTAENGLLRQHLPGSVLSGGKRLRPLMLLATVKGCNHDLDQPVWDAAVGIELLHSFALIHDDVIDGSPRRRSKASFHEAVAPVFRDSPLYGSCPAGLAILAGDILYAAAMARFQRMEIPAATHASILQTVTDTALITGAGTFEEVETRASLPRQIDIETLKSIYTRKTAEYTFVCPLQLGAILADMAPESRTRLVSAGREAGVAYQMHDDLNDLRAFLERQGDCSPISLSETAITLPVFIAYKQASPQDKAWLEDLYHEGRADREDRRRLQRVLAGCNARQQVEARINSACDKAIESLRQTDLRAETIFFMTETWEKLLLQPASGDTPPE